MTTVKKGERTQVLHNDVQVAAFKANGWEVVETAKPKQETKPKAPAKPKGSKNTKAPAGAQEPPKEPEQGQEPPKEPEQEPEG